MSKIIDVRVKWNNDGCMLKVLMDSIPSEGAMKFEEREHLYLAVDGDYVHYFYYDQPVDGTNGWTFKILMKDGSERVIEGPGASNPTSVNAFFPEVGVVQVCMTQHQSHWNDGKTFLYGAVLLEGLVRALKEKGFECGMIENHWGEPEFHVFQSDDSPLLKVIKRF